MRHGPSPEVVVVQMQTESSIIDAARHLDEALEAGDEERIVGSFAEDCELELLGVRLMGRAGVRTWLDWVFARATSLRFDPQLITVHEASFVEEFDVEVTLRDGSRLRSRWAEVIEFRENLVTSLRLYFNPLDLLEAEGRIATALAPAVRRFARRGLRPWSAPYASPPSLNRIVGVGKRGAGAQTPLPLSRAFREPALRLARP